MKIIEVRPNPNTKAKLIGYIHDVMEEFPQREPRPAVILCPGGGYKFISDREGDPTALKFFALGYQVFILHYTVKADFEKDEALGLKPLTDLSLTIMLLREKSSEWRVDTNNVCVFGYSGGGHLAASSAILWDSPALKAELDTKNGQNMPNAVMLGYPVIYENGVLDDLFGKNGEEPELRRVFKLNESVDEKTRPLFIWHTLGDVHVPADNSLKLATALQEKHLPYELHLFPTGTHGLVLANNEVCTPNDQAVQWFPLCKKWLSVQTGFNY